MIGRSLLPADTYIVNNKTILNDFDKQLLITFYEPILGSLPISLYLTLWNDLQNKQISREYTHHHLMGILRNRLDSIKKARIALEAVGLLKTYLNINNECSYIYELYSPLTPREFFSHPILNVVLYNNIGEYEYENLKNNYKKEKLDLKEYQDITVPIDKVFNPSTTIPTVDAVERTTSDIKCDDEIDFDLIMSSIPKNIINERAFNSKTRELINQLAFIYDIDSLKFVEIIRGVLNEFGMVDKIKLRDLVRKQFEYNHTKLPTLVYRSQPEYLKSPEGDTSKRGQIIKIFESLNPVDFLQLKNKGVKPTNSEMKIIEKLIIDMELTPAVVNVLIDYVLKINNNKFTLNYVETIAAQWKRASIKTAKEAMAFAEKENKKFTKKISKDKKISITKEPVWFNKNIESSSITEQEQLELESIMKEFK